VNIRANIVLRLAAATAITVLFSNVAGSVAAKSGVDNVRHGDHGAHDGRSFDHIFIIMMENTGNDSLLGNPNAPWINSAVQQYNVAGNYYGVTHPSQPNYVAATSGSLNGVTSDSDTSLNVTNVVDQLEARHLTWRAYMQSLNDCVTGVATPTTVPGESNYKFDHACGDAHYGAQLYERKHDSFVSFQDVATNPSRMANVVDFSQLQSDLSSRNVPNYVWISPDQCHDMHGVHAPTTSDPCDFSQVPSLISMGDSFLQSTVSEIMASPVWDQKSVIFITWDEADFTGSGFQGFGDDTGCCDSPAGQGGGHVLTIVIPGHGHGPHDPGLRGSFVPYNHYSQLATVEANWNLGCLANTCDTANVQPMSDLFDGRGR
jgi:phosphatidylinositol-3-phosphatase